MDVLKMACGLSRFLLKVGHRHRIMISLSRVNCHTYQSLEHFMPIHVQRYQYDNYKISFDGVHRYMSRSMPFLLLNKFDGNLRRSGTKRCIHSLQNKYSAFSIFGLRGYATKASKYTLKNETYKEFLSSLEAECKELNNLHESGVNLGHHKRRRLASLNQLTALFQELKTKYEELEELNKMQQDEAMQDLVKEEKVEYISDIENYEKQIVELICPEEVVDDCDIMLEIESGAGGLESMHFVEEVMQMYRKYAQSRGWQFEITSSKSGVDGLQRCAEISGERVYSDMKYEGGVHRVQRIPKTERSGRVHTSTISVAILPKPKEIQVSLTPKDLEITTMRSSGPGGQNVDTTNSCVRIKHIPTGIVVDCQEHRSQNMNKKIALKKLETRIFEKEYRQIQSATSSQRKIQVGHKDRSEKIRTYNFPQSRVTDHRLGCTMYSLDDFMAGGPSLHSMITKLCEEAKLENLDLLVQEFESKQKMEKKISK